MLNVEGIEKKWLNPCGSCDAGLPMSCTCPQDDPRHVIMDLCTEVRLLRRAALHRPTGQICQP